MKREDSTQDPAVEVLLVEDNPGDARLVKESLAEVSARAFHLTHVERLEDAIRRLEHHRFDVVLLDLLLQDSQRLGTLMEIHQQAPKVPIVVFTGLEDDVVGLWALSEGAEDYICEAIDRHGKEAHTTQHRHPSRKEHQS
jgi:CheY-like chemotaxis protein